MMKKRVRKSVQQAVVNARKVRGFFTKERQKKRHINKNFKTAIIEHEIAKLITELPKFKVNRKVKFQHINKQKIIGRILDIKININYNAQTGSEFEVLYLIDFSKNPHELPFYFNEKQIICEVVK
ncbi:hypothetical protein AAEX28_04790 [Lentisphaerota bacterium WC36G]|nr:hypothetical protein LJT99_07650 [Lentisphaerae bacterium WC36]